jgi:hypothetical protein
MGKKRRERVATRRADRKEIKMARIEGRTDRVEMRQDTKKTAYEMGIDPNAAMWEGISSLGKSAADVAGKALSPTGGLGGQKTGGMLDGLTGGMGQSAEQQPKSKMTIILLAVAAIVVFLFMRKK